VDKQSVRVKWNQRCEHSSRSVSVNSQHSKVSLSMVCRGAFSHGVLYT